MTRSWLQPWTSHRISMREMLLVLEADRRWSSDHESGSRPLTGLGSFTAGSLLTIGPSPTQGSVSGSGSDSVSGSVSPSGARSGLRAAISLGKCEQEVT